MPRHSMLCLLIVSLFVGSISPNATAQTSTNSIINALKARDKEIHSVEVDARYQKEFHGAPKSPTLPKPMKQVGIRRQIAYEYYALSGEKSLLWSKTEQNTTQEMLPTRTKEEILNRRKSLQMDSPKVYDGKNSYLITGAGAKNKTILLNEGKKDGLLEISLPGYSSKLDRKLTHDDLNSFKMVGVEQHPNFGKLVHLSKTEGMSEHQIWIATEKDYLIVKETLKDKYYREFEVKETKRFDERWVPTLYCTDNYMFANKGNLASSITGYVDLVRFNAVSDKIFNVAINTGDRVQEINSGVMWAIGAKGQKSIEKEPKPKNQSHFQLQGWLYTTIIATLLALTVFAYVLWKQKQRAKRS